MEFLYTNLSGIIVFICFICWLFVGIFLLTRKKKYSNELTACTDVSFDSSSFVSYQFAEAATRVLEQERAEEPTDTFIEDVVANIQNVLAMRTGLVISQIHYSHPWHQFKTTSGSFECWIKKDWFILKKGDKECYSKLKITEITEALKNIGVLKW